MAEIPNAPHIYKHGYVYLFSDRNLVKQLIESFVSRELASETDFSVYRNFKAVRRKEHAY